VLAARGELDDAVALAREAAEQEAGNADITSVAQTLVDVSEVLVAPRLYGSAVASDDVFSLADEFRPVRSGRPAHGLELLRTWFRLGGSRPWPDEAARDQHADHEDPGEHI
jgi:hypothetical protein